MPRKQNSAPPRHDDISTGVGASDGSSGGGNATGVPDAETGMQPGGLPPAGNVQEDREKLFPGNNAPGKSRSARQ
jgi:hypothetical protein